MFIIFIIYKSITFQIKEDKENKKKLKERAEDQYIIEPETGAKLTLEQAESGAWDENQVDFFSEDDYEKVLSEDEKNAELAIDLYRKNNKFKSTKFDEQEIEILENSQTLIKYDEWHYSNCFSDKNRSIIFFVPSVRISKLNYTESQMMFWVKIENTKGHYHLYEVNKVEKILVRYKNRQSEFYNDYYCEILKRSQNFSYMKSILKKISEIKGFEFEIIDDNLLIKSTRLVCKQDIDEAEKLISIISEFPIKNY